jgi:hypothetical protein
MKRNKRIGKNKACAIIGKKIFLNNKIYFQDSKFLIIFQAAAEPAFCFTH